MFRFIRLSLLGMVLGLPFAMPQISDAAAIWYRPVLPGPVVVVNPVRVVTPLPIVAPIRIVEPIRVVTPIRVIEPIGVWRGGVFIRR